MPISQGASNVQYVKIMGPKKKGFRSPWGRALFYIVYVSICINVAAYFMESTGKSNSPKAVKSTGKMIVIEAKQDKAAIVDDQASEESETDVGVDLDAEDAWFLPFGWPQRKAPVPYKASDEEWTEFRKFSTNEQKKREARAQAVGFISFITQQNQTINKILGPPIRCTKHWLDIDYPMKYSDGYEING